MDVRCGEAISFPVPAHYGKCDIVGRESDEHDNHETRRKA